MISDCRLTTVQRWDSALCERYSGISTIVGRQVSATIGRDGSVSGNLVSPDESRYGVFWGSRPALCSMGGTI